MFYIITIICILSIIVYFYFVKRKTKSIINEKIILTGKKYYIEILPKKENPHYVIHYNHSLIPTYPPDINIYPKTLNALTASVILNPGDMLYIPIGWYHCVVSEGDCIALSTNVMDREEDDAIKHIKNLSKMDYSEHTTMNVDYSNVDSETFKLCVDDSIPVLIKGYNVNHINRDYLVSKIGNKKISLGVSDNSSINSVSKPTISDTTQIVNATYNDYVMISDDIKYKNKYIYMGQSLVDNDEIEYNIPEFWKNTFENKKYIVGMWCSNKKIDTGIHYDITHNLLHVITGKKTVYLYPPSEKKNLYIKEMIRTTKEGIIMKK